MFHMLADCLGYGIGAGNHLVLAQSVGLMATDADELFNNGLWGQAGTPGQGNQAANGLALAGRTTAGLAHHIKEFKLAALLILVNGDIHRSTTRLHLKGFAGETTGPVFFYQAMTGGAIFMNSFRVSHL